MTGERVGAIPSNIVLLSLQAIRRNASDTGFEAFTPGSGGDVEIFTSAEFWKTA